MDEPRTAATLEAIGEQSDAQWNQTRVALEILQQQSGHSNASKLVKRLRSVTTGVVI